MIDAETTGAILRLLATVAIGWLAIEHMLFSTLRDAFRAEVFDLRRELFLYAAKGNIAFNHPAYVNLRSTMNYLVSRTEECTPSRFLLFGILKPPPREYGGRFEQALTEIKSREVAVELERIRMRFSIAMLKHLLCYPLSWLLLPLVVFPALKTRQEPESQPLRITSSVARTHRGDSWQPPMISKRVAMGQVVLRTVEAEAQIHCSAA